MVKVGTRIQSFGNFGTEADFGTIAVVENGYVTIEWDRGRRELAPAAILNSPRMQIVSAC